MMVAALQQQSSMFKQLPYFHSIETDISSLNSAARTLTQLLSDAYTSSDRPLCTVQTQIDSIIEEQQYLQDTLSTIELQVATNSLVPAKLGQFQLQQLQPSLSSLPPWFVFVVEEEYEAQRNQLNRFALDLFKMHGLDQKRKALMQERESLMVLSRRNISIQRVGASIDLLQEAGHLKDRLRHVRRSYQYFCLQVAKKIKEWVQELAQKSRNFHSGKNKQQNNYLLKSPVKYQQFPLRTDTKIVNLGIKHNKIELQSNTFAPHNENYYAELSKNYNRQPVQFSNQSYKNSPKSSQNRYISTNTSRVPKQPNYQLQVDYTSLKTSNPFISKFDSTKVNNIMAAGDCLNHNISSSRHYQHTCHHSPPLTRIRSANLQQSPSLHLSPMVHSHRSPQHNGKVFDYRSVIGSNYY